MGIRIRDDTNVLRTAARIRIRDAGNVLRTVQRIRIRDSGNVLRTVYTAGSGGVYFSTPPSDVSANRVGVGSLTGGPSTGVAAGGTGPYTYAWTYVSGASFTITTPAAASTTFSTVFGIAGVIRTGVYRLTATDSLAVAASALVNVELESL